MILVNPAYNNKTIDSIANILSLTYKCEIKNTTENKDEYQKEYLNCIININNEIFKQDIIDFTTFKYLLNYPQDFNNEIGKIILYPSRGIVDYPDDDYTIKDYSIDEFYLEFLNKMKILIEIEYHSFALLIQKMIGNIYKPTLDEVMNNALTTDYEVIDNKEYEEITTRSGKKIKRIVSNRVPEGYVKKFIENYNNDIISLNRTEDIIEFYLKPAVIGLYK